MRKWGCVQEGPLIILKTGRINSKQKLESPSSTYHDGLEVSGTFPPSLCQTVVTTLKKDTFQLETSEGSRGM